MSSPAEKAKARREKILARANRGNKVSMVTEESMAAEEAAKIKVETKSDVTGESSENDPSSVAAESPKKDESSSEEVPSTSTTESAAPLEEKDLDAILDAGVEASKPKQETPVEQEKKPISRPLAERRRLIAEKKARAVAEAAAAGGETSTTVTNDEEKPVEFISKSAREVEMEIAGIVQQKSDVVDADNDSMLKELKEEKVLMGRDRGNTGSGPASLKRRSRTGAGAGGSGKSDPRGDSEDIVVKKKDEAKEKELARKIAQIADKERTTRDANAIPKLVRTLTLVSLAAYTGYTSYLQSANDALTTDLVKQEMYPEKSGFNRDFFDFSTYKPSWMKDKCCAGGDQREGGVGLSEDLEAAFDEASGATMTTKKEKKKTMAGGDAIADLAPTFECSKAWLDGTSIPFLVIMALGTASDRLLKTSTGNKDEGIAGYLTWFWENYDQGMDLVLEYVINYFGEYSCYWMVIVGVSSGLSYLATHGTPEALDWDVSKLSHADGNTEL